MAAALAAPVGRGCVAKAQSMSMPVIGYAGMTHLGLNSAAAAAEKGFETICFDPDPDLVAKLVSGKLPVMEPG